MNQQNNWGQFIHDFFQTFDIERIKDRANHEYLEGGRAEDRMKQYLEDYLTAIHRGSDMSGRTPTPDV